VAKEWGELAIKIAACTAREYFNVSQSNGLKMLCHSSKPLGYFSSERRGRDSDTDMDGYIYKRAGIGMGCVWD